MQREINKLFANDEEVILKSLIGKNLKIIRHDSYINSNVSFRKVSFLIDDKFYILLNTLENIDFMWDNEQYGDEDVAVFKFQNCDEKETLETYGFGSNLKIIDSPVNLTIKDIVIIEDDIRAYDSKTNEFVSEYKYVKGIIFVLNELKYCFSRSDWFVEHIQINKGENPESKLSGVNEDWTWGNERYSINTRKYRSIK